MHHSVFPSVFLRSHLYDTQEATCVHLSCTAATRCFITYLQFLQLRVVVALMTPEGVMYMLMKSPRIKTEGE